jgi:hypothetical protein
MKSKSRQAGAAAAKKPRSQESLLLRSQAASACKPIRFERLSWPFHDGKKTAAIIVDNQSESARQRLQKNSHFSAPLALKKSF